MSLQLACDYLGIAIEDIIIKPRRIILPCEGGDIHIPLDTNGALLLNYSGPLERFKLYSYIQILHEYNKYSEGGAPGVLDALKDKIIFLGHIATGTVDARVMPFSNTYPAVGGHATAFANIIDRDLIHTSPIFLDFLAVVIACLTLAYFTRRGRKMIANLGVMCAIFFGYSVFSFLLFAAFTFWISTFTPLLAILVTYTAVAINHYETVRYEKRILENELQIAKKIQESFLPKEYPKVPFLEFAARCNPAKHVGGDLYDFAELEDEKVGVMIGDVSGKGVGAALYMARGISSFRTHSRTQGSAAGTLSAINDTFAKEGMEKSFITMQYIVVDKKTKRFTFSNGGHNTILHFVRNDKKIVEIDTKSGMPIGIMEGMDYEDEEIRFGDGDILFLYTDGISEAMDKKHKEFGIERVKKILMASAESPAEEIMFAMYNEIAQFSKGAPQHDDMTVIVVRAV
jgi:serine phosphatase RsbU (regulator of sigma subunit)